MIFFNGFKFNLYSPENIIKWSIRKYKNKLIIGEIKNILLINLYLGLPYNSGLFCEKIFGPIISWSCKCNIKYNNKNIYICDICNSEINDNNIRRYRLGFIKLYYTLINPLYSFGQYSCLNLLLNLSSKDIKNYIYNSNIMNYNNKSFSQFLFSTFFFKKYLKSLNLIKELKKIKELLFLNINVDNNLKKFNFIKLLLINNINPEWFFIDYLPIIPAGLRPFFIFNNKTLIIQPITNVYKKCLLLNNKLYKFKSTYKYIKHFILQKKLLQDQLDILFLSNNKSISILSTLKGKHGLFRYSVLGKRVDFSSRTVINPSPDLILNKIGLPFYLGIELYKPLLLNLFSKNKNLYILQNNLTNINSKLLFIKYILYFILKNECILINRAPTLHRMNLQGFKPYLKVNSTLKINPIVCSSFNADFDGDQMSIFTLLHSTSLKESKTKLYVDKNIFNNINSKLMYNFKQTSLIGLYNLLYKYNKYIIKSIFSNKCDVLYYYNNNLLNYYDLVWHRIYSHQYNINKKKYYLNSIGKIITKTLSFNF